MRPKRCQYGNHVIDEDKSYVTFYVKKDGKMRVRGYACNLHDQERRVAKFLRTQTLTTGLMVPAIFAREAWRRGELQTENLWFERFHSALDHVQYIARMWEHRVWFGGQTPHLDDTRTKLSPDIFESESYRTYRNKQCIPNGSLQQFVNRAKYKGYRADVDGITYLSYSICGRSLFQIDDDANGTSVGIILDETSPSPRCGIQSITATAAQASVLIERAISDWQAGKIQLSPETSVGF